MKFAVIEFVKRIFCYIIMKKRCYGKKVVFKGLPTLNRKVFFEGMNAVYPGVVIRNSHIGLGTYIGYNTKISMCNIGRYCTIADNVRISLGKHPSHTHVSIHPAFYSTNKQGGFSFVDNDCFEEHSHAENTCYHVVIGNDVWIANNVLIMDGVTIGDGAIIAAGSVVTKNVNAYEIVGGTPAKFIKKRFAEEDIEALKNIQWWNSPPQWLKENAHLFQNVRTLIKKNQQSLK